jgi:hypothetical protein
MSLSSHLKDPASPVGQFIKQRFAHTNTLTREVNRQLKNVSTMFPNIQAGEQYPYAVLGTAIDYRIRYAFEITPYQRLVAWQGALKLTTKVWESENDTPFDWDTILDGTPLPVGISGNMLDIAEGPYPTRLVKAFFDNLDAVLKSLHPVGQQLEPEAEQILDRYCIVLTYFEQVFRSSAYLQGPLMQPAMKRSVEELLALPADTWLDDLGALFNLFYNRYQELLNRPHVLNPTFAGSGDVGGADADMVVDGCLIDIKTSISPQIKADYLYQLAGYVLLDYADALHLNAVGIYMARQGILFAWPISTFLQKLTSDEDVSLAKLRQEFQVLFQRR